MKSRFYGALLGLVLGDTLGTPIELEDLNVRTPMTCLEDAKKNDAFVGLWSNDTSLALCLLDSLLEKGFDQEDQLQRFIKYMDDGEYTPLNYCIDIDHSTYLAIQHFRGEDAAPKSLLDLTNGSLARTVVAALYQPNLDALENTLELTRDISQVTHRSTFVSDCCQLLAKMLVSLLNGVSKEDILSVDILEGLELKETIVNRFLTLEDTDLADMNGNYNVLNSLMMALKCFQLTDNFEDGLLLAVNKSICSNTIGAIYGQLAGCYYGIENLPWLDQLLAVDKIMNVLDRAWKQRGISEHSHADTESVRYGKVIKARKSKLQNLS